MFHWLHSGHSFYGEEITYPDNTKERVDYSVLPYPTFAGGKIAIQRGAAGRWPNLPRKRGGGRGFPQMVYQAGAEHVLCGLYRLSPVTHQAFAQHMEREIAENENLNIRKLLRTAIYTMGNTILHSTGV